MRTRGRFLPSDERPRLPVKPTPPRDGKDAATPQAAAKPRPVASIDQTGIPRDGSTWLL
jgi:hypothetical protein